MLLMISAIICANSVHKWSTGKKIMIFGSAIFWDIVGLVIIFSAGFILFMKFIYPYI